MNDVGLDRVRQDPETMKQVAGTDLPFGREDLKWGWIDGLVFVPLAAWAWLGPGTYMSLAIILSLLATLPGGGGRSGGRTETNRIDIPVDGENNASEGWLSWAQRR